MNNNKLAGIVSALVTPFDAENHVNVPVLRRIVQHAMSLGVAGFYVCGTTGEGMLMSEDERKLVTATVCEEVNGRLGVVVNISHMELPVALRLAAHAAEAGADAISSLPPLYFPISGEEMIAYFLHLLDACPLPLTFYNIPMLTNVKLDEPMVQRLAEHPEFIGIKHSSEDTFLLSQFKQIAGGRLLVWAARDAYYLGLLAMGADGAIGSSYALTGDVFVEITRAYQRGDVTRAERLQARINQVHRRLQVHGAYRSYKRCFELLGIPAGHCRSPHLPLDRSADPFLSQTLELLEAVRCEARQHGEQ